MLRKILIWLLKLFGLYEDKCDTPTPFRMQTLYEIKPFMTEYERRIYSILLKLGDDYKIIPQVNMASIIRKKNNDHYYSDLFRNIDFAIFDKDCSNLLMLIEIDDSTHNSYKRRQNEEGYVLNRILKNLNNNIDNKVSNTEENNTYTLVR